MERQETVTAGTVATPTTASSSHLALQAESERFGQLRGHKQPILCLDHNSEHLVLSGSEVGHVLDYLTE
jgi:hypothetical protein